MQASHMRWPQLLVQMSDPSPPISARFSASVWLQIPHSQPSAYASAGPGAASRTELNKKNVILYTFLK
jgi:hypothetical protein